MEKQRTVLQEGEQELVLRRGRGLDQGWISPGGSLKKCLTGEETLGAGSGLEKMKKRTRDTHDCQHLCLELAFLSFADVSGAICSVAGTDYWGRGASRHKVSVLMKFSPLSP